MPAEPPLKQTADILRRCSEGVNADTALREFAKARPNLPAAVKRDLAGAVFAYFRWFGWLEQRDPIPVQVTEALRLQKRFEYDTKNIKDQELPTCAVPEWVLGEIDFSSAESIQGQRRIKWLRSLQTTPPLWLRARPGGAKQLSSTLRDCTPPLGESRSLAPDALAYGGTTDLFRHELFQNGAFQIQDLASQAVGTLCAPQPGETWWDACAGEGGKALHLADQMQNKGTLWCSDRSHRRLETLRTRFKRAGLFNYRVAAWESETSLPTKTKFDGILVDAPCSGLGTWARNPDARWTTTPTDVAELAVVQARLLNQVAVSLKPGGRLIYAVCTLTRRETTDVANAFTAAHPELEPLALHASATSPAVEKSPAAPTADLRSPTSLFLWPHEHRSNGMFIAAWRRR